MLCSVLWFYWPPCQLFLSFPHRAKRQVGAALAVGVKSKGGQTARKILCLREEIPRVAVRV